MRRSGFVLALALCGTGCASFHAPDPAARALWQAHRAAVQDLAMFGLRARIGVAYRDQAWQGTLDWQQSGAHLQVRLLGPLAQGGAVLEDGPTGARLEIAGQAREAEDAGTLTEQMLGLKLPWQALGAWLRGLPAAEPPPRAITVDAAGHLVELAQGDWHIRYDRYGPVRGLELPLRMTVRRGDFSLRVVIADWRLHAIDAGRR